MVATPALHWSQAKSSKVICLEYLRGGQLLRDSTVDLSAVPCVHRHLPLFSSNPFVIIGAIFVARNVSISLEVCVLERDRLDTSHPKPCAETFVVPVNFTRSERQMTKRMW